MTSMGTRHTSGTQNTIKKQINKHVHIYIKLKTVKTTSTTHYKQGPRKCGLAETIEKEDEQIIRAERRIPKP